MSELTTLERIEKAIERLSFVCRENAFKLRARIPVGPDDDDIVIFEALLTAKEEITELEKDKVRLDCLDEIGKSEEGSTLVTWSVSGLIGMTVREMLDGYIGPDEDGEG